MNIYITGDTHGDIARRIAPFYTDIFNVKFALGDILIVCGDFGVPWRDRDKEILKFLEKSRLKYCLLTVTMRILICLILFPYAKGTVGKYINWQKMYFILCVEKFMK